MSLSEQHRALIERVLPHNASVTHFMDFRCGFEDLAKLLDAARQDSSAERAEGRPSPEPTVRAAAYRVKQRLDAGLAGDNREEDDDIRTLLKAALSTPSPERAEGAALLQDANVVHINMLRGGIAKLTPAQIGHLYRGDEASEVIREVARQNPGAEGAPAGERARHEGWRCFQCDELFMDERAAVGHFGRWSHHSPACMAGETFQGLKTAYNHLEADFYAMKSRAEAAEAALSPPAAEGKEDPAPAAEPVAWRLDGGSAGTVYYADSTRANTGLSVFGGTLVPLYASPPPEPAAEPVAWRWRFVKGRPWRYSDFVGFEVSGNAEVQPLYASPPPEPVDRHPMFTAPTAWWAETGTAGKGDGCNAPFWLRHEAVEYVRKHGGYVKPLYATPPEPVAISRDELVELIQYITRRGRNGAYVSDIGLFADAILAKMKPNLKEEGGLSQSQPGVSAVQLPASPETPRSGGGEG